METSLRAFTASQFTGKPVLADSDFFAALEKVNQFAMNNGLQIVITSSARQQGVPVGGAIVHPASKSNHLVGHAIDMNILLNGRLFNGIDLSNQNFNTLPQAIKTFITSIRQDPALRWGGDFNDPVHIDDGLNIKHPLDWNAKFPIIQAELIALTQPHQAPGQPRLLQLTRPLMQGEDVRLVQQALKDQFNFDIDVDGIFGSSTDAALTAFQESHNLTVDGIVGESTRKALNI